MRREDRSLVDRAATWSASRCTSERSCSTSGAGGGGGGASWRDARGEGAASMMRSASCVRSSRLVDSCEGLRSLSSSECRSCCRRRWSDTAVCLMSWSRRES